MTIDDVGYVAIDEATKKADVDVVYAKSFYAGAAHASGPLSGEMIGIIAGSSPDEIRSGLDAIQQKKLSLIRTSRRLITMKIMPYLPIQWQAVGHILPSWRM